MVPAGMTQSDLALELGLSAHLQTSCIELEDAIAQMWAVRQAVLEASDMDLSTEPVPFGGRSERLGLLNMVIYLGNLLERAATLRDCKREAIVDLALVRPVLQQLRAPAKHLRERRTS
jgi:hypothetical protein